MCRPVFDVLAETLRAFSLSLVKIVCGYFGFPAATAGRVPERLFSLTRRSPKAAYTAVACHGGEVWASCYQLHVFNSDGKYLRQLDSFPHARKFRIAANGDVFCVQLSKTVVCNAAGKNVREFDWPVVSPEDFVVDSAQDHVFAVMCIGDHK